MAINCSANKLLLYCVYFVLAISPIDAALQQCLNEDCADRKEGIHSLRDFSDLSNDFENDWHTNWIDESQGGFKWSIENYNSTSWGKDSTAPPDASNGQKYIRVHRWEPSSTLSTFGVAILRSQPFSYLPEDVQFSFSFWIRSKWPEFNNLEVRNKIKLWVHL